MNTLPVLLQFQEPPDVLSAPGDWARLLQGLLQKVALLQAKDMKGSSLRGRGWGWQRGWWGNKGA